MAKTDRVIAGGRVTQVGEAPTQKPSTQAPPGPKTSGGVKANRGQLQVAKEVRARAEQKAEKKPDERQKQYQALTQMQSTTSSLLQNSMNVAAATQQTVQLTQLANAAADARAASKGADKFVGKGAGGIVGLAASQLGAPYIWADANPKGKPGGPGSGFDCSGLTLWAYQKAYGISLPHKASEQQRILDRVGRKQLQVGDLVFFNYGRLAPGVADHVGIYIGNGQMIDASSSNGKIVRRAVDWDNFLHGGTRR